MNVRGMGIRECEGNGPPKISGISVGGAVGESGREHAQVAHA